MKKIQIELSIIKFFLVIIFVSGNFQLIAQGFYAWTDPSSLTDSISNNCNPDIKPIWENGQEKLFMVWEKSYDSLSTAIYMKDVISPDVEIEVLAEEGVHYTNPKIFSFNYYGLGYDTLFYLFYESNQMGNKDLYYLSYTSAGNFSEPQEFYSSVNDDHAIDCNSNFEVVWLSNEDLFYAKYSFQAHAFDAPVSIDIAGCYNPKMDLNYRIYWEKKLDTLSHIYKAEKEGSNLWSDPIIVYDSGFAANLNKDAMEYGLFVWSALTDSIWKLYVCTSWSDDISEYDFESFEELDPAITQFVLGVKSSEDYWECYITFPYEDNGFDEIYVNHDPGSEFVNLSNSGTNNRNPNTFFGEQATYDCFYVYDVWESWQNNHWQLMRSKIIMCIGGIGENESAKSFIQLSPNPFSDEVHISYTLENRSEVKIEITDLYGKRITTLFDGTQNKGEQSIKWTTSQNSPSGVYFILLRKDNELFTRKIIKSY